LLGFRDREGERVQRRVFETERQRKNSPKASKKVVGRRLFVFPEVFQRRAM
jgi:hypothetical protein